MSLQYWSWLEIAALAVLRAMMNEVVDIVTEKEELENIRASLIWMNSWSEEDKPPEDWTDCHHLQKVFITIQLANGKVTG